jgi:hypothetical protein
VVVHSDGTLRPGEGELLRRHLPGVRLIWPAEADARAREALGTDSFLARYRATDAATRRVIDTELWGRARKRIILDSDVIVLREPYELIDWVENGTAPLLFGQPPDGPPGPVSEAVRNGTGFVQDVFIDRLDRISRALGMPAEFPAGATGGLYGATGQLTLENLERVVRAGLDAGVPMYQWGGDQTVVLYLLAAAGAKRLDPDRYLNFDPGCVAKVGEAAVLHFYGTHRFYQGIYTRLAAGVVADLCRAPAPAAR